MMKELLTNKILNGLPNVDFQRLLPHLEPVSIKSGDQVYRSGDDINSIYFPESAVISHLHVLGDGSTTEVSIIGSEGMIGLSALLVSQPPAYWTKATVGGSALRVRLEIMKREFDSGGEVQRLLLRYARARMDQLSQRAVCNGRHTVEERVCSWLLMLHDRVKENQLMLTHEQMALHLGVRRAGVTGIATNLKDRGIIDYKRGTVRIIDRQRLEATACECYEVVRRAALNVG